MDKNCMDAAYCRGPMLEHQCRFKAVADGFRIVGGMVSIQAFDGRRHLNSLFVHPEYRRLGMTAGWSTG